MKTFNNRWLALTHKRQNENGIGPTFNPEKNLWAAVLSRALRDSIKYRDENDGRSARGWINSTFRTEFGSFMWVCQVLNMDHRIGAIREMANHGTMEDHDRLL